MEITEAVEIAVKYEGYIKRQEQVIEQFKKLEHRRVPDNFDYQGIKGFSNEVAEKLQKVRPSSVGASLQNFRSNSRCHLPSSLSPSSATRKLAETVLST